jgi:hypothetical protein
MIMRPSVFGTICLAITSFCLIAIVLLLSFNTYNSKNCVQIDQLIYQGRDTILDRDLYYGLDRTTNVFRAFGAGFDVIQKRVNDIQASSFQMVLNYGNNILVPTEFKKGINLSTASVTLSIGDSSPQIIPLQLIRITNVSQILREAFIANILSQQEEGENISRRNRNFTTCSNRSHNHKPCGI